MIVLEGPDGAGKTTLLTHLQNAFPHIDTHERFSASVGGPVDDLSERVLVDMTAHRYRAPQFYDRHPFISEFIYGPIVRGGVKDNLDDPHMMNLRDEFFGEALIILCLPQPSTVISNVRMDPTNQMPGVLLNIGPIYEAYNELHRYRAFHTMIWYDYEVHTLAFMESRIKAYYERKMVQRGLA